eukprot:136245_1
MNTDEFVQAIIDESESEIEYPAWWMSEEQNINHLHIHPYPTPLGYKQINANDAIDDENDINEEKEHFYPSPKQINQPLVPPNDNQYNGNNPNIISSLDYELQLIYKKLLLWSIIAFIVSFSTLIGGFYFYKLKGLILNILVLFSTFFGIFCGFYKENKQQKKALRKLKCLLIYFIICSIFIFILFLIELIYLLLLPINNRPTHNINIHLSVLIGTIIFFLGGIVFWLILVFFYIDLIARACLKRGRIGYIVKQINNSFWFKIFALMICFRLKFRNIRRHLTHMTGINFVALKPILSMDKMVNKQLIKVCVKEHEEAKIKAILEEGGDTLSFIDIVNVVDGHRFNCFKCHNGRNNEGEYSIDYLMIVFRTICILIIFYVFLPLFMLIFCVLLISIPGNIVLNMMKLICGCQCNVKSVYHIFAHFIGFLCWIYVWFWIICANPTIYGNWNWNTQCNMWNYSMFVFVRSVIKAVIAPIFN